MPVDDRERELRDDLKVDISTVQVQHVAPQIAGWFQDLVIEGDAKGFVFIQGEQPCLGVLDGVEDAVNAGFECRFHKALCGQGDRFQPFQHGFGIFADVRDQASRRRPGSWPVPAG